MISTQFIKHHPSLRSCVLVIMVMFKILFLFPPLLLLANAQSGGRLGYFARPDFRRLRPWERPTVAPVPDTPMPTERVTAHITDYPKTRTELPTFVSPISGAPVSSAPRWSSRSRVWSRPGFQGSRPIALSTPTASTPTESITFKADAFSPTVSIVSPTTEPQVYIVTPSKRAPFVENHAQYRDPNNFDSRGRYSPKLTHNNDEIQSDSTTTTTKFPLTTEKITDFNKNQTSTPVENISAMVSSTSTTTTESVISTIAPTTAVPFINNDLKYKETVDNNLDITFPTEASLHLNERTTELRTTPKSLTTPQDTFIPTTATNFNSKSRFPPYMSHNLNVPTAKATTTTTTTTELPSSTTESAGYSTNPSKNIPFFDEHKGYEDIYLTTKTPTPIKIISTTEVASTTTNQHYPNYQVNQNDENNIASDSEVLLATIPKTVTMLPTEPEEYFITTTTKFPFIDLHKEFNDSFISQFSVEYTNGQKKTSERTSKSDYYNTQIYPIYHHETEEDNHYEQYSSATREPERYTVAITSEVPSIDLHKMYDVGFTSEPPVEYTNGYAKSPEIPSSSKSKELIQNIYQNNNPTRNNYEQSVTPTFIDTSQSLAHPHRHPKTTTEQSVMAQTLRHTNSYRYTDMTTKPTTRYTTTTAQPSRLKNVYDVDNFECKEVDAYYSIPNQCDEFIDCKSGHPIQNTCPDGLHFNPAAKYSEFPCAYPSEVKCEGNSVSRQPEPTSECPRRYGFFSMQDGRCDKYIMCQEGKATVMSCPAGLAFSVATSSCDWPANVPDCLPEVFQGFTCPAPELNEDGEPTRSIYKYRYDKSCKKYIACQKGHPRLLSCDSGLAFDENSESCIDEFDVTDCT